MKFGKTILLLLRLLVQFDLAVTLDFFSNVSFAGCMSFSTNYEITNALMFVNNEKGFVYQAYGVKILSTGTMYTDRIANYEANLPLRVVSFCIINTTQYDGGNYNLTSIVQDSKPVVHRLYILDKPNKAEIRILRDGIVNTQLACIACKVNSTSVPSGLPFTFTWILNNTQIPGANGSEIYMNVTRVDRFNNYKCFGKEKYGQISDTSAIATLDPKVLVSAVTIKPPGDELNVTEDENQTFTCTTDYSRPAALIIWYVGGHNIKNQTISQPLPEDQDVFITSSTLVYLGKDTDHKKTIYCEAMNIADWKVKSEIKYIFINVPVKKVSITPPGDNSVISVVEGDKHVFNCTTDPGRPAALIYWYIGGKNVTNQTISQPSSAIGDKFIASSYFIYTGNNTDHNETILCEAVNIQDRKVISNIAYIFIKVPVKTVIITPTGNTNVVDVVEGENQTFTCTTGPSRPAAWIQWYIGGRNVTDLPVWLVPRQDGNMFISSSILTYVGNDTDHNKDLYCEAVNIEADLKITSINVTIHIKVLVKTANITPTGNNNVVDVVEGENQTFTCTTGTSRPAAWIQWYIGGQNVTSQAIPQHPQPNGDKFISSSSLIYKGSDADHNKSLYCGAVNIDWKQGVNSTAKTVYIQVKPKNIKLDPQEINYTIRESQNIAGINCTASCRPECTYYWTGPNSYVQNQSNLILGSVLRNESGIYTCHGTNKLGTISSSEVNIEALYPPFITNLNTNNSNTTVAEGSTTMFQCDIESNPKSDIEWKFITTGEVVHQDSAVLRSYLQINKTECVNTGIYKCEATNIIDNVREIYNRTIRLKVLCSVRVDVTKNSTQTTIGIKSEGGLNITVYLIAVPPPVISWIFYSNMTGNTSTLNSTNVFGDFAHVSNLQKLNISHADFGEYILTAYNDIGLKYNRSFIVIPQRPPNPPSNISVSCNTKSIKVIWKAEFNGGDTQTFTVMWWDFLNKTQIGVKIPDYGEGNYQEDIITSLEPGTLYFLKIAANNSHGTVFSNHVNCTTDGRAKEESNTAVLGAVTGSLSGLFVILLIVGVSFNIRRRIAKGADENGRTHLTTLKTEEEDEDGMKDNVLYQSAGPNYKQQKDDSGSEYAAVQKKRSQLTDNNVQETALYSEVKGKSNKKPQGDVFSNVKNTKTNVNEQKSKPSEDVYQNIDMADNSSQIIVQKENKNKDGLQYAELVFNPMPNGSKFVIRGIDDRTIYATVDTTQNIDPLPDSDDDKNSKLEQRDYEME